MPQETISLIIPAYNAAQTIGHTLDSANNQTRLADEMIFVDDGSDDETVRIAQEHCPQIQILRQDNGGPAAARNLGLAQVSGSLIAFLDADDRWPLDALETLENTLRQNPAAAAVRGTTKDIWPDFEHNVWHPAQPYQGLNLASALFRRSVFDKVGLLNEQYRYSEDFDFWLRIKENGLAVVEIDALTLYYFRRPGGDRPRSRAFSSRFKALKALLDRQRGRA